MCKLTSPEQEWATSPFIDSIQTRDCGSHIHGTGNHTDHEWVGDTSILEELGAIVEDKVDSSELLESLEETASCKSLPDTALKAVEVCCFAKGEFVLMVGLNFTKLVPDSVVIFWKTAESRQ